MPDNNIKIAADITFNTKDAERQLSGLGNTVSKSVSASKQIREIADSFNKISTRNMEAEMSRVVKNIRATSDASLNTEHNLRAMVNEYERLKNMAMSGTLVKGTPEWLKTSNEYQNAIAKLKEYRDEYTITQGVIERGSKLVGFKRASEGGGAIYQPLSTDELEQEKQKLIALDEKITTFESHLNDMVTRGDAFPQLTQNIEMSTVALNKNSEKLANLLVRYNTLATSAPQAASATEASLNGVYDAMSKMSGINMAQPVQANATAIEQSMQDVTQTTTENVQQVQQQVEGIKQTVAQPVQAQIIDTSALQNQVAFLSGILTNLTSNVNTQMSALTQSVTSGFQGIAQQSASNMQNAVGQITAQVSHLESAVGRAESATSRVGSSSNRSSRVAVVAFGNVRRAVTQVFGAVQQLGHFVAGGLRNSFSRLQRSVDRAFSQRTFKRGLTTILKYGFGVRSLYFAFRKLRTAVKEGLQNLVKYEKAVGTSKELTSTNYAITQLRTSLLYLKNAWAAAFAPIINAVMPYLRMLIDGIASAGNAVARFIAVLTGQQNVIQAVKVSASDYADSLDDAAKSAGGASSAQKKLNDRLAAFDDLNVLGKDNDNDSGGGGGSALEAYEPNPSDMFTIIDSYSDFADKLKDAFEKSGFFGIGKVISDSVSDWLANIDWEAVKQKANEVGTAIGDLFRGLFGNPAFWSNLGDAGAGIANALIHGLKGFLDSNKDVHYGQMIAEGFNNFLKRVDWKQAGANIHDLATGILDNLIEFFKTINTDELDGAIHDFLGEVKLGDILWKLGEVVIEAAKVIVHVVGEVVMELGEDLGETWFEKEFGNVTADSKNSENFQEVYAYYRLMQTAKFADFLDSFKLTPTVNTDVSGVAVEDFSFADKELQQKLDAITNSVTEQKKALDATRTSWSELNTTQINSIYSSFAEIEDVSGLYSELKNIVDANGKVMDGYEYRAEFIIGKLNEALGIEIEMNDGVIKGIDGIANAIDRVIAKKKAQIILNAQEEIYADALMNLTQATKNLEEAEASYNGLLQEKTNLQNEYNRALATDAEMKEILQNNPGYVPTAEEFQAWSNASALIQTYDTQLNTLNQDIETADSIRKGYQATVAEYTTTVQTYEANMVLAEKGLYDSMVINIKDGTDRAKSAWDEGLDEELSAISGKNVKIVELGNGMVQLFVDTVGYGIPMSKEEMMTFANETVQALMDGTIAAKPEESGEYITTAVRLGIDDPAERTELRNTVTGLGDDTIGWLNTSLEVSSPSKKAEETGKYFVEGVGEGIGNQNKQSSVFAKVKSFGETLLGKLKNALQEKSPSKATEEMGLFLLEGLTQGIDKEAPNALNTIAEFGDSVVDAFGGVADDVQSPMENMIEFVGGFIDILVEGISTLISKISELATIQPTLSEFSRPSLPTIPMPSIAEGTVIPANSEFIKSIESQTLTGDEQYAMVKQAIADVMANNGNGEVVRLLQQLIGVVESKNLVIGDKEIGKANARYVKQQNQIRGASF